MSKHPYSDRPDYCYWRRAHNVNSIDRIDPFIKAPFKISRRDQVATAGSCFAQHIAQRLRRGGFGYMVTEHAHPLVPKAVAARFNYGVFSARYGNIYTARQLLQLRKRVYGEFSPVDDLWITEEGRYLDPFRPTVEPGGFVSADELHADRKRHFEATRRVFEDCDVFVFTFGLTETFMHRADGAVYPVCPGVSGGTFDPDLHVFKNFRVDEIVEDYIEFLDGLKKRNRNVKPIITVSPVPLVATAEDRSVIVSTAYSKSVLRVACQEIVERRPEVVYFPSYEIVTGNFARGKYFAEDCRSVNEAGVAHVMKIFMRHFVGETADRSKPERPIARRPRSVADQATSQFAQVEKILDAICDEELLDRRR